MRGNQRTIERDRTSVSGLGSVEFEQIALHAAEIVMEQRVVWLQLQSLAIALDRCFEPAQLEQGIAEVGMRRCVGRIELDGCAQACAAMSNSSRLQ